MNTSIKGSRADKIYDAINYVFLGIISLLVLYPLYFVLIASFSGPEAVNSGQVVFLPQDVTIEGYIELFKDERIWIGYRNTILYTFFGTLFNLCLTMLAAYPLAKRKLPGKKFFMAFFLFVMFFNGGLIPLFILVQNLNLYNTPFVLPILGGISIYNLIIAKSFIENTIPSEIEEAASIDGCGQFRFFFSVVLPLSKALLGVLVVYYGMVHWNQYFNALIYVSKDELQPLQMILREILIQNSMTQAATSETMMEEMLRRSRYAELIKYGAIIVASVPALCVYPFVQKYFEKGVMIGSVKG